MPTIYPRGSQPRAREPGWLPTFGTAWVTHGHPPPGGPMRFVLVITCCTSAALSAQTPPPAVTLSRSEEIRLALSAAPRVAAQGGRVSVLEQERYVVAEPGKTAVACQVSRSQARSLEPECGDQEADQTVLAIERFRAERRLAGQPN